MTPYEHYEKILRSIDCPVRRKLFINSCYPMAPCNEFRFHDPAKAIEIQKEGEGNIVNLLFAFHSYSHPFGDVIVHQKG